VPKLFSTALLLFTRPPANSYKLASKFHSLPSKSHPSLPSCPPPHTPQIGGNLATGIVDQSQVEADAKLTPAELRAKGAMRVATHTAKGVVPYNKNKVNQDRAMIEYGLSTQPKGDKREYAYPDVCMFGVCDGHGEFGHEVAEFVKNTLPRCLAEQKNLTVNPEGAILAGTAKMCAELAKSKIDCSFSGTTCVFGLKIGDTVYVANIGDSRAVLFRKTADNRAEAVGLSEDQKPENEHEKARILKAGGRVEPLPGPPGEDCGPPRVWLAEYDVPGLAMSRSIGDLVSQTVGVISVPEIIVHKLNPDTDLFIIWASDGVWEFMDNADACAIINKCYITDLKEACNEIVKESTKRWKKEEEVVDDITW
jgi:serine/threonine protein phosphatase PrpC